MFLDWLLCAPSYFELRSSVTALGTNQVNTRLLINQSDLNLGRLYSTDWSAGRSMADFYYLITLTLFHHFVVWFLLANCKFDTDNKYAYWL